ncbi:RNA 3'-terminal phosphate cyclase-domain-containing protein [Nemania sp. FL0916]|nr:RNA 3'-terminal phosphate cyclase-domain-containing protein [Nemania sp. FL0916]
MKSRKPLLIEGSTGEGGGQIVRVACVLAAITSQPIRIVNVRGNRSRGGGLKSQHVSSVEWLAKVTGAEVEGLAVGSRTLEFRPVVPPTQLEDRKIVIRPKNVGSSALLIFQAVFPFLLFAGNEARSPIEIDIHGSTNASFSPSYEYLDQVLLPTLEDRFGVVVERQLKKRAWTIGPSRSGNIWLKFQPISPGETLKLVKPWGDKRQSGDLDKVKRIDLSILVPGAMQEEVQNAMTESLSHEFPEVEINFLISKESGHDARMYVLAVAHSESGLRWGQDCLYDGAWKKKKAVVIAKEIAKTVTKRLWEQTVADSAAAIDEHLQDQLVVFQALAKGRTTYWTQETESSHEEIRSNPATEVDEVSQGIDNLYVGTRMRKDKAHAPFGFGSTHTTTARWIASELLPTVQWFNNGTICEGAGISL